MGEFEFEIEGNELDFFSDCEGDCGGVTRCASQSY